jgi:hypothetical protein
VTRETYDRLKAHAAVYYDGIDYLLSRMSGGHGKLIAVEVDDQRPDDQPLLGLHSIHLSRRDYADLRDFLLLEWRDMADAIPTEPQQETGSHAR